MNDLDRGLISETLAQIFESNYDYPDLDDGEETLVTEVEGSFRSLRESDPPGEQSFYLIKDGSSPIVSVFTVTTGRSNYRHSVTREQAEQFVTKSGSSPLLVLLSDSLFDETRLKEAFPDKMRRKDRREITQIITMAIENGKAWPMGSDPVDADLRARIWRVHELLQNRAVWRSCVVGVVIVGLVVAGIVFAVTKLV